MAWPLIRIDLDERSKDFQRIALQPGFPVLDRFAANNSILRQWLGRFAAEAQWDEQTVRFLWRDEQDETPPTEVQWIKPSELTGSLRDEIEVLQSKLKQAAPKSPNERVLLTLMQQRLERAQQGSITDSANLFKVRVKGRWRLVWCWGYERRNSSDSPLKICGNDNCRLAFIDDATTRHRCPRCGRKVLSGKTGRKVMMAMLLLLLIAGLVAWDRAGRPGFATSPPVIRGLIVDEATGRPIPEATVQQVSEGDPKVVADAKGEFEVAFPKARQPHLQISATGYQSAKWEPPAGKWPRDRQRIALRGDAEATGLVVEAQSDRPIPFPVIKIVSSDQQTTGDDVGLFLLPGIRSGKTEFEVAAEGYRPARLTQELPSGKSPQLLFSLVGSGTVVGTVVDAYDRRPVAGAIIKVSGLPEGSTSDSEGRFRRSDLPGTTCRFDVAAPGYVTREFERPVAASGETTLRFLLRPELTSLEGVVVDSSEASVPSATVRIVGTEQSATTSTDGLFRLSGVRQGTLKLEANAGGYAPRTVDAKVPHEGEQPFRIVLGGEATLIGHVTDATRRMPVSGAQVRLADGRWKTTTNAQGQFEIKDLPTGMMPLEVIGSGYRAVQVEAKLAKGDTSIEIELKGATVLSGIVISAFDQQPLAGAEVQLEGLPLPHRTDAEGRFRFEDVVAGAAKVSVSAEGYVSAAETKETRPDEETVVWFALKGSATLRGKVIADDSSQPISQAVVAVAGTDRKLLTNDDGEFSQADWPARLIELVVSANGYSAQEQDHDLRLASVPEAVIRLKRPHVVRGVVVDARSDKPVAHATVKVSGASQPAITDDQGRFQLDAPVATSHEFVVNAAGYAVQSFVEQTKADAATQLFKLSLQRDSEEKLPATPTADTTPTSSPSEQPGSTRPAARNPQEVEFFGIRTKAANVAFVVDCSGSMQGTRLERTKLELLRSVLELHPKQMFYVAFFDDKPYHMFDTETQPVVAKPVNKVRVYKWMKSVQGGGGTNPAPALSFVAKMSPQSIFLLSDGVFDPLPEPLYDEFKQKSIRVNTIAFEDESGKDELARIATRTQGAYRFVPAAPIPEFLELTLVTRLYDELLEQWIDPQTTTSDAQDAHEALIELCNGQDFGPRRNASDAERRHIRDEWRRWWVENKLTPELLPQDEAKLKKSLSHRDPWWRWASVEALNQKGVQDGAVFMPKVRDPDGGIQQATRRALVRLAVDEDHGPAEGAGLEAVREAYDKWTEWLRRTKYFAALKTKPDDSLVHDFDSSDTKLRRAALEAAAERSKFAQPSHLIAKLTDQDLQVRQSAHAALVKTANKDFGPGDCTDMTKCEVAAKAWNKWYNEKAEGEAEKTLRLAESFESNKRNDQARDWYQKVIQKHPGTDAAAKAASKLKSLP